MSIQPSLFVEELAPTSHSTVIQRASNILLNPKRCVLIPHLGLPPLATVLPLGFTTGDVLEISGGSRLGKTQMCLQLTAHLAGQCGFGVAYVDTSGSFDEGRLITLLQQTRHA
jgi:hypothetical protein